MAGTMLATFLDYVALIPRLSLSLVQQIQSHTLLHSEEQTSFSSLHPKMSQTVLHASLQI